MRDVHRNWRLSATNDLQFVEGASAAAERLTNALGTQNGEWRFDTTVGMSWLYDVLSQRGDNAAIRQLITEQILRDNEVDSVGNIRATFDASARRLTYTASVRLVSGVVVPVAVP